MGWTGARRSADNHWRTTTLAALIALTLLGCGGTRAVERARLEGPARAATPASTRPAQALFVGAPDVAPDRNLFLHRSGGAGEVHASTGGARLILASVPQNGSDPVGVIAVAEQRAWASIREAHRCADRYAFYLADGSIALSDTYLGDLTAVEPAQLAVPVAVADGRIMFWNLDEMRGKSIDCRTGVLRDLGIRYDPPIMWMQWTPRAGAIALTSDGAVYRAERLSEPFVRTALRHTEDGAPLGVRDGAIEIRDGNVTHLIPTGPLVGEAVPVEPSTRLYVAEVPNEVAPWFIGGRGATGDEQAQPEVSFQLHDGGWFRDGRVHHPDGRLTELDVCESRASIPFNRGALYFCRDGEAQVTTFDRRLLPVPLPFGMHGWDRSRWKADPLGPTLACEGCGPDGSTIVLVGDDERYEVSASLGTLRGVRGGRLLVDGEDWAGYWVGVGGSAQVLNVPGQNVSNIGLSDDGVAVYLRVEYTRVHEHEDEEEAPRTSATSSFWASFDYGPARPLRVPPGTEFVAFAWSDLGFAVAGLAAEERRAWVSRDRGETWAEIALDAVGTIPATDSSELARRLGRDAPASEALLRCTQFGCRWYDVWLGVPPLGGATPVSRAATPLRRRPYVTWECTQEWVREPMYPVANWAEDYPEGSYVDDVAGLAVEVRGRRARLHIAGEDERGAFEWTSAWGFESPPDTSTTFALLVANREAALVKERCRYQCEQWIVRPGRPWLRVPSESRSFADAELSAHGGALHWTQLTDQPNVVRHITWTPARGVAVVGELNRFGGFAQIAGELLFMRRTTNGYPDTWIPSAEHGDIRMSSAVALCSTPAAGEDWVESHLGLARVQITPDGVCLVALQRGGVWLFPDGNDRLSGRAARFSGEVAVTCQRVLRND